MALWQLIVNTVHLQVSCLMWMINSNYQVSLISKSFVRPCFDLGMNGFSEAFGFFLSEVFEFFWVNCMSFFVFLSEVFEFSLVLFEWCLSFFSFSE